MVWTTNKIIHPPLMSTHTISIACIVNLLTDWLLLVVVFCILSMSLQAGTMSAGGTFSFLPIRELRFTNSNKIISLTSSRRSHVLFGDVVIMFPVESEFQRKIWCQSKFMWNVYPASENLLCKEEIFFLLYWISQILWLWFAGIGKCITIHFLPIRRIWNFPKIPSLPSMAFHYAAILIWQKIWNFAKTLSAIRDLLLSSISID